MTYTINLDRDAGTYTIDNPDGQQIDSGDLPLSDESICSGIMSDKGVAQKTADAVLACMFKDWELNEV